MNIEKWLKKKDLIAQHKVEFGKLKSIADDNSMSLYVRHKALHDMWCERVCIQRLKRL